MPAIQVTPDRFKTATNNLAAAMGSSVQPHVRRPVRGIQIKDDSFATLRVVAGSGNPIPIVDAGSRRKDSSTGNFFEINGKRATDIYSNFFIQQVNEERVEKQQILETFGEAFIFLFGERARMIQFSGVLVNTFDFNWEAEWWYNYDNYLRGTRCVENDARVFLSFDETLVTGYIVASSAAKNAVDKNHVNFQFTMFVTGYVNFSKIGDPNAVAPGVEGALGASSLNTNLLNALRPTLIDTNLVTGSFGPRPVVGGVLGDFSLVDGLAANVNAVAATFNTLSSLADTAVQKLSDLANGVVVRVPVGFAGAMEFDDNIDLTQYIQVTGAGVIEYSTFDKNSDEYVGVSDHYGSSSRSNLVVTPLDQALSLARDAAMVAEATAIWAAAGFSVPVTDAPFVANMLVNTGFGLASVGSNAAWANQLPLPTPGIASVSPIRVPLGPGLVEG